MTNFFAKTFVVALAIGVPSSIVQAQEADPEQSENHIAIGVGFASQHAPFKSAKSYDTVIPLISIKQGPLYFEGAEAGVELGKQMGDIRPSISLFAAARVPAGRDRQKLSVDAGARVAIESKFGILSGEFRHDVSDKFNGSEFIARYSLPISTGRFLITPSVQASWLDQKAADHMYGITADQRARMIRKMRAVILPVAPINDNALNLGGGVSMAWRLTDRVTLITMVNGTLLDKSIRKSPAVEQKWEALSLLGLSYRF
jgi:outer membrane protein